MAGPDRATIVAHALAMDRIKAATWHKKTGTGPTGDTYAAGVACKARRVKPTFSMIQAYRGLLESGGCIWQVIDETGALMAGGFETPSGYLLISGVKWFVEKVEPTAGEVVLLTGCYREPA